MTAPSPPGPPALPAPPVRSRRAMRGRAAIPAPVRDPPSQAIAVPLPVEMVRYARSPIRWRPGCEVTVLRDGAQTYPAMLAAIEAAERSICLETYILAGDRTGDRFKAALVARARAGVAVRIIYDAVGSFGLDDAWVAELRAAGCQVLDWNPIAPWRRRFRLSHRDHRKILVIDDRVGFTGGLNIANDYASVEDGGEGWHDMHCRVTGKIVLDLARMFRRTWLRGGGAGYPLAPDLTSPRDGGVHVRLLDNTARQQRTAVRRAYLHVIRSARQLVRIQNAYFMPDRGLRRAMINAVARGVDVRVMVPGRSDVKLAQWATLYVLRQLAKHGVKIFLWRGVMMHAKTATVDALWSTIGSYNFDAQSRFNNLEVTVEILDAGVGQALVETFAQNQSHAEPFDEQTWLGLPWWRKALAWFAYRLRRLL